MTRIAVALATLLAASGLAYQADLVPANHRAGSRDVTGQLSIAGAGGAVHASIDNLNDGQGDPLDGSATLQLRLRVNGLRRRVSIPIDISGGSGAVDDALGLRAGDQVVVNEARVRGPDHRTVAQAGVVTADPTSDPTPPPAPPASLGECQADLSSCSDDLAQCNQDLDDCLSAE